jgi:hypothetical protein
MVIIALVFVFCALLAIARELHTITDRLIEVGTLIEHLNRRDLRSSGIKDVEDNDFASESVTKAHRTWRRMIYEILFTALALLGGLAIANFVFKLPQSH